MSSVAWFSRQGAATSDNRDHGACSNAERYTTLALVDASPKGKQGQRLAREWCKALVRTGLDLGLQTTQFAVNERLKAQHQTIRTQFIGHTASYVLAVIDPNGQGWSVVCGDCRMGYASAAGHEWFSPVHTLASGDERHILTRFWNAKRFANPDWCPINQKADGLILASDGYWVEHGNNTTKPLNMQDDASSLIWMADGQGVTVDTDNHNFLIVYSDPT